MVALIILLLFLKQILPTANLFILALTALCLAIAVIEGGVGMAAIAYLAAALLSLAWPGLAVSFPFIFFFGPYPLLRAIIDQRFGRVAATLLKLVVGNILTGMVILSSGRCVGIGEKFHSLVCFLSQFRQRCCY